MGKCVGVSGRVWGSVLGCEGRCRKMLGEMWESVLGCESQGCELDRFLMEFKKHLQVRVQVLVQRFIFFEFKFEFGKNDRVHNPV